MSLYEVNSLLVTYKFYLIHIRILYLILYTELQIIIYRDLISLIVSVFDFFIVYYHYAIVEIGFHIYRKHISIIYTILFYLIFNYIFNYISFYNQISLNT